MLLQQLAKGFAEDSHTAAVDYADAGQACQEGAVDESFYIARSVVDGLADYVDFCGDVRVFIFQRDRDAAGAGRFHRSLGDWASAA